MAQPGYGTYDVVISFHDDRIAVEYPKLSCGGTLHPVDQAPERVELDETITHGLDACVTGGAISLLKSKDGEWVYTWTSQRGQVQEAIGLLSRRGGPAETPAEDTQATIATAPPSAVAPPPPAAPTVFTPDKTIEMTGFNKDGWGYYDGAYGVNGKLEDWQTRPDGSTNPKPTAAGGWYIRLAEDSILRDLGFGPVEIISRVTADYQGIRYETRDGYAIYRMLDQLTAGVLYSVERVPETPDAAPETLSFLVQVAQSNRVAFEMMARGESVREPWVQIVHDVDDYLRWRAAKRAERLANKPAVQPLSERIALTGDATLVERLQAFMDGDFDALDRLLRRDARIAASAIPDVTLPAGTGFGGSVRAQAMRVIENARFARLITAYALTRMNLHGRCGEPVGSMRWNTVQWTEYRNGFGHYRGRSATTTSTRSVPVPTMLRPPFRSVDTLAIDGPAYERLAAIVGQLDCTSAARRAMEANMAAYYRGDDPVFRREE